MKNYFAEKLRDLMQSKNVPQRELAKRMDINEAAISRWVNGVNKPQLSTIIKISAALGVHPSAFEEEIPQEAMPSGDTILIPVLARIPAGLPAYSEDDIIDRIAFPRHLIVQRYPGAKFAVEAVGDSMEPDIFSGDLLLIKPETSPLNNRIMLVKLHDDGFTIKRVVVHDGDYSLVPRNAKHKTVKCDAGRCKVIGLVVGVIKSI